MAAMKRKEKKVEGVEVDDQGGGRYWEGGGGGGVVVGQEERGRRGEKLTGFGQGVLFGLEKPANRGLHWRPAACFQASTPSPFRQFLYFEHCIHEILRLMQV